MWEFEVKHRSEGEKEDGDVFRGVCHVVCVAEMNGS